MVVESWLHAEGAVHCEQSLKMAVAWSESFAMFQKPVAVTSAKGDYVEINACLTDALRFRNDTYTRADFFGKIAAY